MGKGIVGSESGRPAQKYLRHPVSLFWVGSGILSASQDFLLIGPIRPTLARQRNAARTQHPRLNIFREPPLPLPGINQLIISQRRILVPIQPRGEGSFLTPFHHLFKRHKLREMLRPAGQVPQIDPLLHFLWFQGRAGRRKIQRKLPIFFFY